MRCDSGHGSLANILIQDFCRDEAPKAPVMLYALENYNNVEREKAPTKYAVQEISRSLWLGDLSGSADFVIPFDERAIHLGGKTQSGLLSGFKNSDTESSKGLYHRSALQAKVMHELAQRMC